MPRSAVIDGRTVTGADFSRIVTQFLEIWTIGPVFDKHDKPEITRWPERTMKIGRHDTVSSLSPGQQMSYREDAEIVGRSEYSTDINWSWN